MVDDGLRDIERILGTAHATIDDLPAPSRRAYEFLKNLNLDDIHADAPTSTERDVCKTVRFTGLTSQWQTILADLSQPVESGMIDLLYESICSISQTIEKHIESGRLEAQQLSQPTRKIRGWLAFFSERPNFDTYLAAVGRATPIIEAPLLASRGFNPPLRVEFRPATALCEVREGRNGTRAILETPMIIFTEEQFRWLADARSDHDANRLVLEATLTEDYQSILGQVEALGGIVETTAGRYHDLAASFERVRREYFENALTQPRLAWSTIFTGRTFGHYEPTHDTVVISCTLDRPDVPEYAIDFVMYHELLHKMLGVDRRSIRKAAHTPEFRAAEQRFSALAEAEAVLKKLTRAR